MIHDTFCQWEKKYSLKTEFLLLCLIILRKLCPALSIYLLPYTAGRVWKNKKSILIKRRSQENGPTSQSFLLLAQIHLMLREIRCAPMHQVKEKLLPTTVGPRFYAYHSPV